MNAVIGEALIIAIVVMAAGLMVSAIAVPQKEPLYKIKVQDAYPSVSSGKLFNVVMVAGSIPYTQLKVILVNSSTGEISAVSFFSGGNMSGGISSNISDSDGSFNTGDLLMFEDSGANVTQGIYRVMITDGKHLIFDGRVSIK